MNTTTPDLTRTTLAVLALGLLIVAVLWVLLPFIGPTIWAATLVVATWPLMQLVQAWLGGRRRAAVAVMTMGMLTLFVAPVTLGVAVVVQHTADIADLAGQLATWRLPSPPAWLPALPAVGPKLHAYWESAMTGGASDLLARLTPYAAPALAWLVGEIGTVGLLLLQAAIVVVLAAVMYSQGEGLVAELTAVVRRLAGAQGVAALVLAGQAVRGVALGVGITAIAQAALGSFGLAIAGVPYAAVLTVVMFVLSIAQVGPLPVLLPAAGWLFWNEHTGSGLLLLGVGAASSLLDNVLRPMLIRRGADIPLLIVFGGVAGGMLAFGLVGIFIGPVVLVVGLTLLRAWVFAAPTQAGGAAAQPGVEP